MNNMKRNKRCCNCGREITSRNIIGLNKKLLDEGTKVFYCLDCLAEYMETDTELLMEKIKEFKEQGCKLFS